MGRGTALHRLTQGGWIWLLLAAVAGLPVMALSEQRGEHAVTVVVFVLVIGTLTAALSLSMHDRGEQ